MSAALAILLAALAGAVLGALGIYVAAFSLKKKSEAEALQEREALKNQFAALSQEALGSATEQFLKLAQSRLETERVKQGAELEEKRQAVESTVGALADKLKSYEQLVRGFEKDREQKYGSLGEQLDKLGGMAETLQALLSNSRTRGQWGERMAEDILRACGLEEGIQFQKNKAQETSASRPDYVFALPDGHKINMDVKFPLDNYIRMANAKTEEEKARFKAEFLRNAKARIKEITKRDYISVDENTLDYVILFIPNEQVYGFLQEADPSLMDEAMSQKVVLCSPFTLYAVLRIIRQAYDNFHFTRATQEIVQLIQGFRQNFEKFQERFVKFGEQLDKARDAYDEIAQTSFKRLEASVAKIDRVSRGEGKVLPEPEGVAPLLPGAKP